MQPIEEEYLHPPHLIKGTPMSTAPNTGPLSQSAVASFVFSSIQVAITSIMFVISYKLSEALSGFSRPGNSNPAFNPDMSGGDLTTAITISAFGIIGFLAGFLAFGSIMSQGKTGFALTMCSMLMSFTCIAITFYPILM